MSTEREKTPAMDTQAQDIVDATVAPPTQANAVAQAPQNQPVTPSQSDVAWQLIEKAMDTDVDLDRLEKLMDMHKTMLDREAEQQAKKAEAQFDNAMSMARSEIERILPNQENEHTKSKFADLDAINAQLVPALGKYGLHIQAKPAQATVDGWIAIRLLVKGYGHTDESFIQGPPDGSGSQGKSNKNQIQAIGSSYTYLLRYAIRLAFNLAVAKDNDGNAPGPERQKVPPVHLKELEDLLEKTGTRVQSVLGRYNINKLEELQPAAFTDLMNTLKQRVN